MKYGFFAYPDLSPSISDAILGAVEGAAAKSLRLEPWKLMRTIGFKLDDRVRARIRETDFLCADITYPNPNVFYEIGYAIALGKPVIPTVNTAIENAASRVQKIGIFDTIGWAIYTNAENLLGVIETWQGDNWTRGYLKTKDHSYPLFILDTTAKTDFRNHIFQAAESSSVNFRRFDPTETPRLTAGIAISFISSASGAILPILGPDIVDSLYHNLRAGFLLGLCHGFEVEALALQYENSPIPLDYRDFVKNSTFRRETEKHVAEFAQNVLVWNQTSSRHQGLNAAGTLGSIDLGSPMAENESQKLDDYFLQTAEYARALRAEGAVVVGRKGSGKSAIYQQISKRLANNRRCLTVDLRPASHNLSELREAILSVVSAGVFDHTIAAFWQYIIYVEILLKIRETALPKSRNDFALLQRLQDLEAKFSLTEALVSGDFTSRLKKAVVDVIDGLQRVKADGDLRSQITNVMFVEPIPKLREAIASFPEFATEIVVLLDDLDKGWPPRQVEPHDVSTLRHLLEVLNRLQRDLLRKRIVFKHLLFLRSDIYELLVEETSDRGKYNPIKIDWSDPDQLRHLLRQRVSDGRVVDGDDPAWSALNVPMQNSDAVSLMIENSLRRPRFLIDMCERVITFAINRGHNKVTEKDVEEGLRQMSLYLVSDFGYEMRDVAGTAEDIFYLFMGATGYLTITDLKALLREDKLNLGLTETVDLLLWYGFLGFIDTEGKARFIYDCAYDFRRLQAEAHQMGIDIFYMVNPAFLRGLDRTRALTTVQ